jgi:hypothetical protein
MERSAFFGEFDATGPVEQHLRPGDDVLPA